MRTRQAIFMSKVHNNSAPKMILGMCWGMRAWSLAIPRWACEMWLRQLVTEKQIANQIAMKSINSKQRKLKMLWNSGMKKWQFYKSKDTAKRNWSMPKKESNNLKDLTYFKSHVSPGPCSKADEVHSNRRKWKEQKIVCGSSVCKSVIKYFEGNCQYILSKAKW